jgi:hypothetical protein
MIIEFLVVSGLMWKLVGSLCDQLILATMKLIIQLTDMQYYDQGGLAPTNCCFGGL